MAVEYFVQRTKANPIVLTDELDERVKEGWRLVTAAWEADEPGSSGNETVLLFLERETA